MSDRVATLRRMIQSVPTRLQWVPPTVVRLALDWIFVQSGWVALQKLARVVEFFRGLGIPAPGFLALFVALTELVCGLLLLVGLFTRLATLPLIVTMIVALATAKK